MGKKMKKIELSHRMYMIHDLKRLHDSKELHIQPKYQRRRTAWPVNAKTGLIDTILLNYPVPPLYIYNYVDKSRKRRSEIIDGQQRLSTLFEFLENKFPLSGNISDPDFAGLYFEDLPPEIQDQFEDYELSCMAIKGASESDIIAIFSRVNSFSLPLNEQEKRNATFAGEFKALVYDLASEYNEFWRYFNVLTYASIARMKDAELVSEFFSVIHNGLQGVTKKQVTKLYEDYEDSFPDKQKYNQLFEQIITYIGNIFEDDDIHAQFKKIIMVFPLNVNYI